MSTVAYKKRVSALDVAELLKAKGVKPSDITVEEDVDEVRITIANVTLDDADRGKIDALMKMLQRRI